MNNISQQSMIPLLRKLVETESPSHDKDGVDRVGAIVAEEAHRIGASVDIMQRKECGNLVLARWGTGTGGILLLCHMDTVFPVGTLAKMPFFEKDGKAFGPGVSDMKGGIAVTLAALASIKMDNLSLPVTALFTPDEEIGSHSSEETIIKFAKESSLVLVLEPGMPNGAIKTWRKGVGEFLVRTRGRAAHAGGDHEKGRNAIEEMAHQVIAIQRMTNYQKGTTLNVGLIRGGIASNVVPDEAVVEVDFRVMESDEATRVVAGMQALHPILTDTSVEVVGGLSRPPMPFDENMRATFEKVKVLASRYGIHLLADGTGGASDANLVAPLRIPLLDGLGPVGGEYHSEREFIITESLEQRAKLLSIIFREWK
jgi:glutamate carboxypeptidase